MLRERCKVPNMLMHEGTRCDLFCRRSYCNANGSKEESKEAGSDEGSGEAEGRRQEGREESREEEVVV